MPLPTENIQWPPASWESTYKTYRLMDAWYSGDPGTLGKVYYDQTISGFSHDLTFWARQYRKKRATMVHAPIASDISTVSADLLFSEPPKIIIPEAHMENAAQDAKDTQERLDDIIGKAAIRPALLEAAETASALGGVFLKPVWDSKLADYPMINVAQADTAIPEFKFGILTAVTFWKIISGDDSKVIRVLERHETTADGIGVILTGVYEGDDDELGRPLNPEDFGYLPVLRTEIPGLAVRYIPNMKPSRKSRGSDLGRSDYEGLESMMESLDETFTSLYRDIRLGMARIAAPEHWFKFVEQQAFFDIDDEVFMKLDRDESADGGDSLDHWQFDIRVDEHLKAASETMKVIYSSAGYSPETFGQDNVQQPESGVALRTRQRKSFQTAAKKAEYWRPALEAIFDMMLIIDRVFLNHRTSNDYKVKVEMQDSVRTDISDVAPTVDLLNRAQAVSILTKIKLAHPDWSEEQVLAEEQRIKEDNGLALPDPTTAMV